MHRYALLIAICFATNTDAETVEKLFVSYIKICNSTTNSKTLKKNKKITFSLQEIHQIMDMKFSLSFESQTYNPNQDLRWPKQFIF